MILITLVIRKGIYLSKEVVDEPLPALAVDRMQSLHHYMFESSQLLDKDVVYKHEYFYMSYLSRFC